MKFSEEVSTSRFQSNKKVLTFIIFEKKFMFDFPVQIGYAPFYISAHLLFETLAFIIGYRYYSYLRNKKKDSITSDNRIWILIGAALGALLFSRLIGSFETPELWYKSEYPFLYFYQNKTIIGGLIGGLIGVELIKKVIGEKKSSGDLFTFPIILAMIIGRIGCFLNGIFEPTYGNPTSFFLGMDLGDGILRHPVSIYEIIYLGILWTTLYFLSKKFTLKNGYLFQYFMIGYFSFRFLIEYIKPHTIVFFKLSTIQFCCLLVILYYFKTIYNTFTSFKKILA